MEIDVENLQNDLSLDLPAIKSLISFTLKHLDVTCDEISIRFVSEPEICQIHADHFDDPSPTDCITFPMDDEDSNTGYRHLGECIICPKAAIDYDSKQSAHHELSLYIVHTILHLVGYKDLIESDIKQMRAQEQSCMEALEKNNLVLTA